MREIKFRAWDKDLCKYLEGCEISSLMADFEAEGDGREIIIKQVCPARYIFEQYTGLKDKNGKEVCEGDIIRYKVLRDDCSTRHGYKYREVIEAVKYDDERGTYITWQYSSLGAIANHYKPEVIGNIHKNGDLLGGEE